MFVSKGNRTMTKDNMRKAYIYNIVTAAVILFSVVWMFSGIKFFVEETTLSASKLAMFKYYTVDSNIIMGISSFYVAIKEKRVLDGKDKELSVSVFVLKLIGCVGVTLTMLVTVFFLAPTLGFVVCFNNSNFLLHVLNPVLSIYSFIKFERPSNLNIKHTFMGIISMLIYATYYVINCVVHSEGNSVMEGYDWYGFFALGLKSGVVVLPIIILITYGISFALWKANKGKKLRG